MKRNSTNIDPCRKATWTDGQDNNHYELLVFGIYCKGNLEIGWEDCLKFVEFQILYNSHLCQNLSNAF